MTTYHLLHTTIDYDGLLDLLELQAVRDSWQHAQMIDLHTRSGS